MKISAVNLYNNSVNNYNSQYKGYSFKGEQKNNGEQTVKTASIIALGITAAVALVKNAGKLKNTITQAIKKHYTKTHITIPVKKTRLEVSADAIRKLPKEIRTKAIDALNKATKPEEKLAVIREYSIGRFV